MILYCTVYVWRLAVVCVCVLVTVCRVGECQPIDSGKVTLDAACVPDGWGVQLKLLIFLFFPINSLYSLYALYCSIVCLLLVCLLHAGCRLLCLQDRLFYLLYLLTPAPPSFYLLPSSTTPSPPFPHSIFLPTTSPATPTPSLFPSLTQKRKTREDPEKRRISTALQLLLPPTFLVFWSFPPAAGNLPANLLPLTEKGRPHRLFRALPLPSTPIHSHTHRYSRIIQE